MEGGKLPPLERLMSAGFTVVDSNDTPVIEEGPVVKPDCPPGSPIMIASVAQGPMQLMLKLRLGSVLFGIKHMN